MVDNFV
jgi:hypothetical protein